MKVAAITRFKHGALYELLKKYGWSQNEFAKRCGYTNPSNLGRVLNLLMRPSEDMIERMERAFGEAGEYVDVASLFPDSYVGFKRPLSVVQVRDIEPRQLDKFARHQEMMLEDVAPPLPSNFAHVDEIKAAMEKVLDLRERKIIDLFFEQQISRDEIGKRFGVTGQTVNTIIHAALKKVRDYIDKQDRLALLGIQLPNAT
jgi:transcriptional regulator with XRE-family HTH domain